MSRTSSSRTCFCSDRKALSHQRPAALGLWITDHKAHSDLALELLRLLINQFQFHVLNSHLGILTADKLINVFQPSKKLRYMEIGRENCSEEKQKSSMIKENICFHCLVLAFIYKNIPWPFSMRWEVTFLSKEVFQSGQSLNSLWQIHTKIIHILCS